MITLKTLVKLCLVLKRFSFVQSYLLWLSTVDGQGGCLATLLPYLPQLNPQWAAFQKSSESLLYNFRKFSRVQKLFSLLETADVFLPRQEFWREFQNF